MKVLDVDLLQDGLQRNITMLERLNTEIKTIQRGVEGLVQMEEQLKGKGGGAIRSFYEECHLPFLQFFQLFSYDAQQVLYQIGKALNSLEPDLSGYILEEFLEGELEQGLTLIGQLTASLTDETNSIMDQVSDIVALPHLDDSAVQEGVINSKRKRDDTLSQLYEFDATQTTALNTMEQDIRTMETWLSDIEGMFKSGLTDVHFQVDNWGALAAKNKLKTELATRTSPVAVLSSIVNRENQLTTMLQAFIAGNGPIRFGYGGLIHINNPFVGTDMLALSCPKPELNGTEQEDIDQNIFVKSFHSFKGIAEDFWDGVRIRREKALDSPYDFVNYWTFGISDGIVSGSNERSAKMFDSKLDFLNYATFGFSGMVKEAILPDDPLSKEHWQNSFGFVGSIVGLRLAATTSPVKKPGNAVGDGKVKNEGKNVTENKSNTSMGKTSDEIFKSTDEGITKFNPLSNPKIAKEIEVNPDAIYGYSPQKKSPLDKFGVDWTNSQQVNSARTKRIKYLQDLEKKKIQLEDEVAKLQDQGMSIEDIARSKVEQRNLDRIQSYIDSNKFEALEAMKERNIQQYGRPEGPTPEQLFEKYGSWDEVIYSSVRSSPAMDVLTGLYKQGGLN